MTDAELDDVAQRWEAAMRAGDFEAAWRETDRIERQRRAWEARGRLVHQPHHLLWNGTPFDDRRVLVRCNHGLGDTLQFARYLPQLRARAQRVDVLAQPHLVDLLQAPAMGEVRNGWTDQPPPRHDLEIEIMELPYAFRSTVETLPARVPYLPLTAVQTARSALPPWPRSAAFRVGLVWSASDWDTTRSVPLAALEPFTRVAHVQFYGLQQGASAQPHHEAPFPITSLSTYTGDICAAAAAMLELDLVITVDCMVAHLAGALGRPVWVMLKRDGDWRWMTGRLDSPWYPTMRLFRQRVAGDWRETGRAVAKALEVTANASTCRLAQARYHCPIAASARASPTTRKCDE